MTPDRGPPEPGAAAQTERARDETITVVGAGPAGLACAIALARGGRKVIVREWHGRVGQRFHGDFQGLENWSDERDVIDELHAAGIEPAFDRIPVREATVFDPFGTAHRVHAGRPLYYLVRRGDADGSLDRGLIRHAVASGAEVRFNDRVETIGEPAVLAIGPRTADVVAVGYVFDTEMPDGDWLALGNRLAPLGYSYLLVHGGRGTVASCMFSGFKRQAEYVERTVAFFREHAGLSMRNPRRFGGFGNFRLPRSAQRGARLVAGEQAGFQDALAGFGMRYAIRSGLLAARSLLDGSSYRRLWRRELLPWLRAAAVNRFAYIAMGERGWRWVLGRISRTDATAALHRLYRPSPLKRLLYPLARLRYRAPLNDPSCDHVECSCVWCECGGKAGTWTATWAEDE